MQWWTEKSNLDQSATSSIENALLPWNGLILQSEHVRTFCLDAVKIICALKLYLKYAELRLQQVESFNGMKLEAKIWTWCEPEH